MAIARLADRAVLSVSGPDAEGFLQGLVTNDMARAKEGRAIYAALLTPQGKVLFDFFIAARDGGYLIDGNAAQADDLLKRLKMYRLRAAVELAPRPDLAVFAVWDKEGLLEQPSEWTAFRDPRLTAMGWRVVAPVGDAFLTANSDVETAYAIHGLTLGMPDSPDVAGEFLLDANGEELNAVDFKKGCYVGQEVTARMKHKAKARRRLVLLAFDGEPPPPATKLLGADGSEVGEIVSGAGGHALASVRMDRLKAEALSAAGQSARLAPMPYPLPDHGA